MAQKPKAGSAPKKAKPKPKPKPKAKDEKQFERFIETARMLGVDEGDGTFDRAFKTIVRPKNARR